MSGGIGLEEEKEEAEYHNKDFEWEELRAHVENAPSFSHHLLPYQPQHQLLQSDSDAWKSFHIRHSSGKFFKMIPRALAKLSYTHRYGRGLRFLSSISSSNNNTIWDPTVALKFSHPTLISLEKCSSNNQFKQILAQIMRIGLIGQTFPMSRLLLYSAISHPENLDTAILLFNHCTPHPNLYIYNTMISALSFSKVQSFSMYNSMLHLGIYPDKNTFLYLLKASPCVSEVKQVHCHAIVLGFGSYGYLKNSLMKVYLEKGSKVLARKVFCQMSTPDVVSFNIMIVGNAKEGFPLEAIKLFHEMVSLGLKPDEFTVLGLTISCGLSRDAKLGKSVHGWIERRKASNCLNLILSNAILDMYAKCNEFELASKIFNAMEKKDFVSWNTMISGYAKAGQLELSLYLFNEMPNKDLVSWNSLIAGFAQNGHYKMVMNLFGSMVVENVRPDNITMVCLVSAAAEIGALDQGKWIHGIVVRNQMQVDAFLGSSLIDMYSKCGSIERAFLVFQGVTQKDVTVWTTMITGLAFHGYGNKALDLFSEMQLEVTPNEVTFVAILTACTHSGLVNEGLYIFYNMRRIFGIEPQVEHYGCLVDLLGRSGRLVEAYDLIQNMPSKPSCSIWGAMLSACRAHGNMELAEVASRELFKLEPEKEGGYILLSNIYAACEEWNHSDMVREVMEIKGVKKTAGCSSVVIDGLVHNFVAADLHHPRWSDIFSIMQYLNNEMKPEDDFLLDMQMLM
ncbi:pentatricopeptide repeat-containing protein At3g04750, mitochondrial isoform X1 [Cannabis sativa]|uniref:pentatricopeptide repeat-containing protein At3g04750, mitochondrial isoform X1 n=1 Tax=Cannabis sativa TaxID=3483 RepID=UPI0029CA840C|nr:pentatricopeptide repeat-containing protein At3g04750, mitochondrial isoform X1 [Cannabis sativa]